MLRGDHHPERWLDRLLLREEIETLAVDLLEGYQNGGA